MSERTKTDPERHCVAPVPPVRDQRGLEACLALATADAIFAGENGRTLPSALFLFYSARRRIGMVNHNVALRPSDISGALAEHGAPPEAAWPFDPARYLQAPPAAVWARARQAREWRLRRVAGHEQALNAELAAGRPVIVCLRLYRSNAKSFTLGDIARSGRHVPAQAAEAPVSNHALLIIGEDPGGGWWARNTAGPDWGLGGHVHLPECCVARGECYGFAAADRSAPAQDSTPLP
jgi:hypothetical protein